MAFFVLWRIYCKYTQHSAQLNNYVLRINSQSFAWTKIKRVSVRGKERESEKSFSIGAKPMAL